MPNLFMVLSPLQLICAQEARERYCDGEKNHLIIIDRKGPTSSDYQQKTIECDDKWHSIMRLSEPPNKGLPRILKRFVNTANIFLQRGFFKGKVFLGDPYINWFRYIGKIYGNDVTWLDDGASSINVIDKFLPRGLLDAPNATTPKFFSIFATPELITTTGGAIIQNDLRYLKQRHERPQVVKKSSAIFIGQWLSERGGVAEDDEVAALRAALGKLGDWELTYVPHRHESQEKLARISEFMRIRRFDRSIEAELLNSPDLPEAIISWYSTALFTLRLLFPEIQVKSVMVPLGEANDRQKSEWMAVYSAIEALDIHIIQP